MHIQIINFNLKDTTVSEYEDLCNQMAGAFAQVPGLLSKVWLADRDANVFGGIYAWRDEQALRAYEATELFQNVVQNPHFANINNPISPLRKISELARGWAERFIKENRIRVRYK